LLQKFPAEQFMVTAKCNLHLNTINEKAGLVVLGTDYASLVIEKKVAGNTLSFAVCKQADKGNDEVETFISKIDSIVYFRVTVQKGALCNFSYSVNGNDFYKAGESFNAVAGKWIGAKLGLFCNRTTKTNDAGYASFDWFRIEPINK
jgi:hypothetical protein